MEHHHNWKPWPNRPGWYFCPDCPTYYQPPFRCMTSWPAHPEDHTSLRHWCNRQDMDETGEHPLPHICSCGKETMK